MKTLLLLRHGSAAMHATGDHARELTGRGHAQARAMGRHLGLQHLIPDLALVSTATRTMQTWQTAAAAGQWPTPHRAMQVLYDGSNEQVLTKLAGVELPDGNDPDRVLVVSHQPTLVGLVRQLAGTYPSLGVGTLAVLQSAADSWPVAAGDPWELADIIRSRSLPDELFAPDD